MTYHPSSVQEPFNNEYRLLARGGRVVWVHDEAILIRDHEERKFWQGVITDVTKQKEAEQSLRETEARFRTSVDHIPVITYTQDQKLDHRFALPECAGARSAGLLAGSIRLRPGHLD
jgi:PAS domain-containing protein